AGSSRYPGAELRRAPWAIGAGQRTVDRRGYRRLLEWRLTPELHHLGRPAPEGNRPGGAPLAPDQRQPAQRVEAPVQVRREPLLLRACGQELEQHPSAAKQLERIIVNQQKGRDLVL